MMSRSQVVLSIVVVLLGLALAAGAVWLMKEFLLPWEPILFWMGIALLAGIGMIVLLTSFDTLEPDVMIALTFFGDVIRVYSPLEGGDRGILNSGLVLVFPPGIVQAHRLPTEAWDIRYRAVGGFTKGVKKGDRVNPADPSSTKVFPENEPSVPCIADLKLTFQLSHDIEGVTKILQAFPLLDVYDLTEPTKVTYEVQDPINGVTTTAEHYPPCIAKKIAEVTQGVLDEAVSRVLGRHRWSEARSNEERLERELKRELGRGTIFERAEMLDSNGNEGRALALFDPNIALIRPLSDDAYKATSAEFEEQHKADAAKARGRGKGDELREIMDRAGVTGQQALAAQTAKDVDNLTIVSAEGLLEGALGRFLGGKGKP